MSKFAWMAPQPGTILGQGEVAAKKRRGKALFNTSLPVLDLQASSGLAGGDTAHARAKTTAAMRDEHMRAQSCEPDFLPQVLPPTPPCDADAPPELRAPTPTHGKAAMQVCFPCRLCLVAESHLSVFPGTDRMAAPGSSGSTIL
jgi:hypothetical protein